jgi:flagellar hook-basal body complex protein FliE
VIEAIGSISNSITNQSVTMDSLAQGTSIKATAPATTNFVDLMRVGFQDVEQKIERANDLIQEFAVDDSVPIHRVMIAIEEARLSVEIAMQVRTKLVDGYRDLMNMQL